MIEYDNEKKTTMADNEWVQCNMCMKVYDDLDVRECEGCETDAYLYNVSGE